MNFCESCFLICGVSLEIVICGTVKKKIKKNQDKENQGEPSIKENQKEHLLIANVPEPAGLCL